MPWYINPAITCKVLNRIANRHSHANLNDLRTAMDIATELIWNKQEHYYKNKSSHTSSNR
jgi:hypothetical protein